MFDDHVACWFDAPIVEERREERLFGPTLFRRIQEDQDLAGLRHVFLQRVDFRLQEIRTQDRR